MFNQASSISPLVDRPEAAEYLGVKPQTLAAWSTTKLYPLPYVKIGRLVKYRKADLDRFIQSRVVGRFEEAAA